MGMAASAGIPADLFRQFSGIASQVAAGAASQVAAGAASRVPDGVVSRVTAEVRISGE